MIKLNIIAVGSIKEPFYRDAVAEYVKRLSRYCRCEIVEVKDEKTPEHASDAMQKRIKEVEGKKILAKIKANSFVVVLDPRGKKFSSEDLAAEMESWERKGDSQISFVIGGSLGLSAEVLQRANICISFSDMIFPHQLMRVILVEQIYRTYRIRNREPYHK